MHDERPGQGVAGHEVARVPPQRLAEVAGRLVEAPLLLGEPAQQVLHLAALDEFPVVDPLSLGSQHELVVHDVHLRVELLLGEDSQVHEVLIVHDPRPGAVSAELLLESLGEGPQVPPVDERLL